MTLAFLLNGASLGPRWWSALITRAEFGDNGCPLPPRGLPLSDYGVAGEPIPKALFAAGGRGIMLLTLSVQHLGGLSPPCGSAGTASAWVCGLFTLPARLDSLTVSEPAPE